MEAREKYLAPIYHQISVSFADLHDTPGRMLQKKVIKSIINWPTSRQFFYWRLRRLIARNNLVDAAISYAKSHIDFEKADEIIKKSFYHAHESMSKTQLDVTIEIHDVIT